MNYLNPVAFNTTTTQIDQLQPTLDQFWTSLHNNRLNNNDITTKAYKNHSPLSPYRSLVPQIANASKAPILFL